MRAGRIADRAQRSRFQADRGNSLPLVRHALRLDNPAMDDARLIIETPASAEAVTRLEDALGEHARAAIGDPGFHSVGVVARDGGAPSSVG